MPTSYRRKSRRVFRHQALNFSPLCSEKEDYAVLADALNS
jgi:hypothetical protein